MILTEYGRSIFSGQIDEFGRLVSVKVTEFGWAITAYPQTLSPGAIASLEAFGTSQLNFTIEPSAITSLEAFGTAQLNFIISITPPLRQYYITGDDGAPLIANSDWVAQTFTPTTSHRISKVKLLLYREGSPGTVTVSIKATDGSGHPTGGDLCVGTTDGDTLPTGSPYEWREITLGAGIDLIASTKYAIVVRALSGSAGNEAQWRYDGSSPTYTGGCYESSSNSGDSWTSDTDKDFLFEEYGEGSILSREAFGTPIIAGPIIATGIASAEAFGTSQLNFTVFPSGIVTTEAFGTSQLNFTVFPSGIVTTEAFGTPIVAGPIIATGIASAEVFGTSQLNFIVFPSAIASLEAFGTAQLNFTVFPSGIVTAEAFGTAQLNLTIFPDALASAEAFGTAKLILYLLPGGIASLEAFGEPQLNLTLTPSGIASLEAFGTAQLNFTIFPSGVVSAEAFGTMVVEKPLLYIQRYTIEIHNTAGELLAVLKDTYGIILEETVNAPKTLTFMTPADESKLSHVTRANEIWVRDVENDVILAKTRLERDDDSR